MLTDLMNGLFSEDTMYCYHCMNQKGNMTVCPYCGKSNDDKVAAHHLRPGTVLNKKYMVGRAIGEGGFGITYVGRDTMLDIRVAIKEFYPSGYSNRNSFKESTVVVGSEKQRAFFEKGKQRFLLEARNVAKFSDEKGIVDVRDFFEANGTAYIIMEYLDGIDLNKYLNTYGRILADKAFDLMLPVMRSLEKINAAGIIHRDISPDNIMYLKDGTFKLMDFGSARHFTNKEKEMSVMLKQGYAPEEQYSKNGDQGPWTDVYGMCATLYRCITGEVPEDGLDRIHQDNLLPPSQLGVRISPSLEAVLMYGLAVFKENRCQNMTELIDLVTKARAGDRVNIRPIGGAMLYSYAADSAYRERVYSNLTEHTYGDSFTRAQEDSDHTRAYRSDDDPRQPQKKKKSAAPVIVVTVISVLLVVGIILLVMFFAGAFGNNDNNKSESTPATEAVTEAPTEAPLIEVPDVTGKKLMEAKEEIEAAGLSWDVGTIESDMTQNYVVEQNPMGGETVKPDTKITLYIPDEKPTEEPTEAPTDEPTTAPTEEELTYFNSAKYSVFLHKYPSRTSVYYLPIPSGAEVKVLESEGEFYKVRYNLFTGYVLAKFFSRDPDKGATNDEEFLRPMRCTEPCPVYYSPSSYSDFFELEYDEEITVVGYLSSENFYEIVYGDTLYYVAKEDLESHFRDTETP